MEQSAFLQISLILVFTLIISTLLRALKQPLLLGYIISGLLLGGNFFNLMGDSVSVTTFSQIGIAFLLFLIGLNLNPRYIKEIGAVAIVTAVGHAILSTGFGWLIGTLFGLPSFEAFLVGVTLTFSSTIIITKILSDLHELETVPGKIISGFLIIQDLLAMFFLIFLMTMGQGGDFSSALVTMSLRGFGLICILTAFSWVLLPRIISFMAKSQELLMLFSISWCLLIASIFHALNFSIEIGALFAGVSLSLSPFRYEISSKIKALRDFFVMLYFIIIGAKMNFGGLENFVLPLIIFSAFVIFIQPFITVLIVELLGFTRKVSFQVGLAVSQVSEFSLIIGALAVQFKLMSMPVLSMITLIMLISAISSSYLLQHKERIYNLIGTRLPEIKFAKKPVGKLSKAESISSEVVLLGFSHFGAELYDSLKNISPNILIVEFDPKLIRELERKNLSIVYGDISNPATQEETRLTEAKLVISTIKDFTTNLNVIQHIRKHNRDSIILSFANIPADALKLYEEGANYVIVPNLIGAHHTATLISEIGLDLKKFSLEKKNHINKLLIEHQIS